MPGGPPLRVERQSMSDGGTIAAPLDTAWSVMVAVYNELGIEPTTLLHDTYTIGNRALKVRRSIGGTPLSRYIDCGSGTGVGPNADYWNVDMTVITQLAPAGEGRTHVQTVVEASARPVSLGSNPVVCSTTSQLEKRIARLAGEQVNK
jgi:hypothetical protein